MASTPTVVDLFCGGGGFTEGFEQAGLDVATGVDKDEGACETYSLNHPYCEVIQQDIMEMEIDQLPSDVDVLVGSPPCTEFSWSKNGGGGDIEGGMQLVKRFLYFVVELDPDYWVMENVPRLEKFLPTRIDYAEIPWLNRPGSLHIPRTVLDADRYGTPQRRSRLFSGNFPVPDPSDKPVHHFDEIRSHLPTPVDGPPEDATVGDPNYKLELPAGELTDHYYNSHLTHREAEEIRVRKEDHSFYGPMNFPDDPNNSSRTVLATNRRVARETLVMEEQTAPGNLSRYRKPTIREVASIQGFPITYQFTGSSIAQKWQRVGDAVPPPVAYEIAYEILLHLGIQPDIPPRASERNPTPPTNLNDEDLSSKGRRKLSIARRFRHHVPYDDMRSFRVDIETDKESNPVHPISTAIGDTLTHPVEFGVKFYRGYAKTVESKPIDHEEALDYLDMLIARNPELEPKAQNLITELVDWFGPEIPDATTLQAIRSRRTDSDEPKEYELLRMISDYDGTGLVDKIFPRDEAETTLHIDGLFDGTELPVRVLFKLVAATYLAAKLNRCSRWTSANPADVYLPEEISVGMEALENGARCVEPCIDSRLTSRYLEERPIGAASVSTD